MNRKHKPSSLPSHKKRKSERNNNLLISRLTINTCHLFQCMFVSQFLAPSNIVRIYLPDMPHDRSRGVLKFGLPHFVLGDILFVLFLILQRVYYFYISLFLFQRSSKLAEYVSYISSHPMVE